MITASSDPPLSRKTIFFHLQTSIHCISSWLLSHCSVAYHQTPPQTDTDGNNVRWYTGKKGEMALAFTSSLFLVLMICTAFNIFNRTWSRQNRGGNRIIHRKQEDICFHLNLARPPDFLSLHNWLLQHMTASLTIRRLHWQKQMVITSDRPPVRRERWHRYLPRQYPLFFPS